LAQSAAQSLGDTVEGSSSSTTSSDSLRRALSGIRAPISQRICEASQDWVKLYHNDAEVDACLDHLPDVGFNVLNWASRKTFAK